MNAKQEAQVISRAMQQGLSPRGVQKRLATTRAKAPKNAPKRHFEQVERNSLFDFSVQECRKKLAKLNGVSVDKISKSAAIRYAVIEMAKCEHCNGTGIIGIRNGDDDMPCPDCSAGQAEI